MQGLVSGPAFNVPGWHPALSSFVSTPSAKVRDIATWAYTNSYLTPVNGVITGSVLENGTPIPHCTVCIYFRESGALISRARTDSTGAFSFGALDPTALASVDDGRYFIIALDPNGGVRYNAKIFDRLVAI